MSEHAQSVVYLMIDILLRRGHGWSTTYRGKQALKIKYSKSPAQELKIINHITSLY